MIRVEPFGHTALFLDQLPEFKNLKTPFAGTLEITGSPVAVAGLRGRYNERGDFLITPISIDSTSGSPDSQPGAIFPFFIDGGGYTTQFVVFSHTLGESTKGVLTFFDSKGAPLPLPVR